MSLEVCSIFPIRAVQGDCEFGSFRSGARGQIYGGVPRPGSWAGGIGRLKVVSSDHHKNEELTADCTEHRFQHAL